MARKPNTVRTPAQVEANKSRCKEWHRVQRLNPDWVEQENKRQKEKRQTAPARLPAKQEAYKQRKARNMRDLRARQKPHVSSDCGKGFSHLSKLKRYMATHTGEKPHFCSDCGKGFGSMSHLKRHMLRHTGNKHHVCSECGKTFRFFSNLKTHKLMHTGGKPHVCSECGKGFSLLSNLKRHMLTHTGEKPHVCSDCGNEFSQLQSLKTHLLTHAEEKVHVHYNYMLKEGWTLTLAKSYCEQLQGNSEFWSMYSSCETCVEGFGSLPELENHLLDHP